MKYLYLLIFLFSFSLQAKVTMTWLGTASYILSDGKTNILFDPFVSRPPLKDIILHRSLSSNIDLVQKTIHSHNIRKLDAVVVTHSHYDHVLDAAEFVKRTGALLIGSQTTDFIGQGRKVPKKQIKRVSYGETIKIGDFSLEFLKGRHAAHFMGKTFWSGRLTTPLEKGASFAGYVMGENYIVSIQHPKGNILSHATPGIDFAKWTFVRPIHALIAYALPLNNDMETLAKHVLKPIKAKKIIPIHWDDFFKPLTDKEAFDWNERFDKDSRALLKDFPLEIPKPEKEIILLP